MIRLLPILALLGNSRRTANSLALSGLSDISPMNWSNRGVPLLLALLLALAGGCSHTIDAMPKGTPTPVRIAQIQQEAGHTQEVLQAIGDVARKLTVETLEAGKAQLVFLVGEAAQSVGRIQTGAAAAAKSAEADAKTNTALVTENESLRKEDPLKKTLVWVALACFGLAAAAFIAAWFTKARTLVQLGFILLALGGLAGFIARHLLAIEIGSAIAAAIVGGYLAWKWWINYHGRKQGELADEGNAAAERLLAKASPKDLPTIMPVAELLRGEAGRNNRKATEARIKEKRAITLKKPAAVPVSREALVEAVINSTPGETP